MDHLPAKFPHNLDTNSTLREGASVVFDPSRPRSLDISFVHTLVHNSVVCCVRFSPNGKYLATGCDRMAQIYDMETGERTCTFAHGDAHSDNDMYVRSLCFSPDGKYLATGSEDQQIRVWDIRKKQIRNIFAGHQQEVYSLHFSQDGRFVISGSGDRTVRIWDMMHGNSKVLVIDDSTNDAGVTSVAISPDGQFVAAGSLDSVVRIWDVNTRALVDRLRGHCDSVYSISFTPDGNGLVSASLDNTIKYWDISSSSLDKRRTDEKSRVLGRHENYVLSVAVSHDGRWVASGSKDRTVQILDVKTGIPECVLQGHRNSIVSVAFSSDGLLATGGGDKCARIWRCTTL
ncbi:general transcription repressor [Stygiomarasmius scandens]|uniref:General transcription repressor n=1 Tax=Marasmiellus scandens TaxID=2682957 RepID=A0ABR1JA52_9AGAR